MRHLHVDAPKKCSCDAFGDGPCPVHADENRLQDERLKQEAEELKKTGVRCHVIGRLRYVIPYGSKLGSFVLVGVFASRYDAFNQPARTHSQEMLVTFFQTEPFKNYDLALASADETYTKCFRTLKEEHALSEGP